MFYATKSEFYQAGVAQLQSQLTFNSKIAINVSHHVNASAADEYGHYKWYYEYDIFEFIDQQHASVLTARSDSSTPYEASFLDLDPTIMQNPLLQFAINYLHLFGKTKFNFLSAYGYALTAPCLYAN